MAALTSRPVVLRGPVDLPATLQGGQAFLWERRGETFVGVIGGCVVHLRALGDDIEAIGAPAPSVARYLRLEPADAARRLRLARDPALAPAMAAYPGLRLLRQDPWETTVAFLTSANNNVLRIGQILQKLVARYGEPIEDGVRGFPAVERIARARESTLRAEGLGYRAPFLRETARAISRGDVDLAALMGAEPEEAREALVTLPGIGPKVADCIALFSLDVDAAFPVDRWILRAAAQVAGREMDAAEATAWARARWGSDAGLAQQYLFHAIRMASQAKVGASPVDRA